MGRGLPSGTGRSSRKEARRVPPPSYAPTRTCAGRGRGRAADGTTPDGTGRVCVRGEGQKGESERRAYGPHEHRVALIADEVKIRSSMRGGMCRAFPPSQQSVEDRTKTYIARRESAQRRARVGCV
eukprot:19747-Pleurochrysis_carterae.AAC.1